ncbi:ribonuclease HI [Cotonvirus japonicus]|uniref:Ribonuclease HI n=1 Tax=Cotonvirus japonicus TaxID=2811091 RepID=A0ABM7NTK8_9VIRU|nr:ribonuclease HI [Cotonvirus japonicus]BCS83431.1 ribonuclease HI [Cotonvirus japonicus]
MIKCYCDASYDPVTNIAVAGWKINQGDICHELIHDTNINRAELQGLIYLIKQLNNNQNYIIFTDCANIVKKYEQKQKIISRNYYTKKNKLIKNSDLFRELFGICGDNIIIKHIAGHVSKHLMTDNNREFSLVDKYVRRALRQILKNK